MANTAETYLILKYGSIPEAYRAWLALSFSEQVHYEPDAFEILMEYEFRRTQTAQDLSNPDD